MSWQLLPCCNAVFFLFVFFEVTEIPDMKKVHSVLLLLATILRKWLLPHAVLGFDQRKIQ